jgi:LmbE family N-acetylglucosaminyl deacetylase
MTAADYRTLVIAPHCDDEVLGCGGILNNRSSDKVFVYYLGADDFHIVNRQERLAEVENVARFLNFEYQVSNNPVNNYDKKNLINEITDVINSKKPLEIFIPNPSYNQDHQEVHQACLVALRPHDKNFFVKNVFIYEVEQYLLWAASDFKPNYFEQIAIEKKIEAYKLHSSQVRSMRPPELLKNFAAINGLSSGYDYAEGFVILRMVK